MQPLTSASAESRKGCSDPTLPATRLGKLQPRHITEERGKHAREQGECLQLKTTPGTSGLELFLKHTAVASTGPHKDISFVLFAASLPDAAMPRLCGAQGSFSLGKSKSCRGCVSAGSIRAPGSIPKQTGLF